MKRSLIILIAIAAILVGGGVLLMAAHRVGEPNNLPATQSTQQSTTTPTVGTPVATPSVIAVNASTTVTVTAQITDPTLIPGSVNLLLLGATGTQPTVLGVMHDDGLNGDAVAGDHIYTLNVTLNEATTRQIQLQASGAFRGKLRRVLSATTGVLVLATPTDTSFTVNSRVLSLGGPLSFNNFGAATLEGGLIPPHGAEIDITSVALPPSLVSFISSENQQSTNISMSTLMISGVSCTQVLSTDVFTATVSYDNVTIYCPTRVRLYKFYLSYNAGDPSASLYLGAFLQVVNSSVFTQ